MKNTSILLLRVLFIAIGKTKSFFIHSLSLSLFVVMEVRSGLIHWVDMLDITTTSASKCSHIGDLWVDSLVWVD